MYIQYQRLVLNSYPVANIILTL